MKHLLVFTLALLFLFNSCEKDKDLEYEDFQSGTLIRQIGASEGDMQIITYYNTTSIFEHLQRFSYRKFLYNNQNQLKKIEIAFTFNPLSCAIIPGTSFEDGDDPRKARVGQYIDFKYSSTGKVESKYSYYLNDDTPQLMNYEVYDYNSDAVSQINFFSPQDMLTHYATYFYDDNGNVLKEEYYYLEDLTTPKLQTRTLYEYDDKINPFLVFAVEATPGINTNKNNITKQTTINYYGEEEDTYTVDYSYEYNDLGYPVKVDNVDYIYGEDQ